MNLLLFVGGLFGGKWAQLVQVFECLKYYF